MRKNRKDVENHIAYLKNLIAMRQRELASSEACLKCCYLNQECPTDCQFRR